MNRLKALVIAVVGIVACSFTAKADSGVYDLITDTITIVDVNISSATGAGTRQLFTASLIGTTTGFLTLMENRRIMQIQNLDATYDVFCRIALSSTSAAGDTSLSAPVDLSTTTGVMIPHGGGTWTLGLRARNTSGRVYMPWCANGSTTGTTKLTITQGGKVN